jgi:flavin-dependent dehydrogenase
MNSDKPSLAYDVVIGGGGLAGLTLAMQLRQEFDDCSVAVVEKTKRPLPEACHKVGESSVELGSQYLESLGLSDYLSENHLFKHGLRFYPGGGHLPIDQRRELGPAREPVVPSYQLDRGRFENDVRDIVEERGAELFEGYHLQEIDLRKDDENHRIVIVDEDGAEKELSCRWFIDATGRNALLRREKKLTRGTNHNANAGWFRVEGLMDVTKLADDDAEEWHAAEFAEDRWRSTNHFMGNGYWVWLIPLATGHTSVGLVVHDEEHGFGPVRSLEAVKEFMFEHEPWLSERIFQREVLDFRCIRRYSHNVARSFSPDRWGMVGEAGAFVDPLYSPGTDYIAFANSFATELINVDRQGRDLSMRVRELNLQYRALVSGNVDLFRDAAPVYDHPSAMYMKLYWDNFSYWSFPCQYYLQDIYKEEGKAHSRFSMLGQRFVQLSNYVQELTRAWATTVDEEPEAGFGGMPNFPSVLIDAHLALQDDMTPDETYDYMQQRAEEGERIVAECLVRVMYRVGDEAAREIAQKLRLKRWDLSIESRRFEAEDTIGLARRRALTKLERDIERTLGRYETETSHATVRELLQPLIEEDKPDNAVSAY